jgi:[acyl-carrier-protein] S-malonyltransferase
MKFAFVFPGQGSQSVGMMQAWAARAEVRQTFTEASDALGMDLWQWVSDGPAELLNQTIHTQPAMLAADVAVCGGRKSACDHGGS